MSFNASKCKVLAVTRKLNPVNSEYHLEDKTLAPVRKEKDLGVVKTSNFTWNQQVRSDCCQQSQQNARPSA